MTPELFGVCGEQSTFTLGSVRKLDTPFSGLKLRRSLEALMRWHRKNSSGIVGSLESEENDEICCQNYLCLEP